MWSMCFSSSRDVFLNVIIAQMSAWSAIFFDLISWPDMTLGVMIFDLASYDMVGCHDVNYVV